MEKTLAIIKSDAVKAKNSGKIIDRIEQEGFNIIALKKLRLTRTQAEEFYAVHEDKGFFNDLITYVISGPIIVLALEKTDAVDAWRDLMGETDPAQAAEGTIRNLFGTEIGKNATHGSDSIENAQKEVAFFFPNLT